VPVAPHAHTAPRRATTATTTTTDDGPATTRNTTTRKKKEKKKRTARDEVLSMCGTSANADALLSDHDRDSQDSDQHGLHEQQRQQQKERG
jgi:ATP-dependent protease HslVU (ClpYQ) peptidase subunit